MRVGRARCATYMSAQTLLLTLISSRNTDVLKESFPMRLAERDGLYAEYTKAKVVTQKVEQIRRSVTEILHSEEPQRAPPVVGMEL